jgi:hypothetical protein
LRRGSRGAVRYCHPEAAWQKPGTSKRALFIGLAVGVMVFAACGGAIAYGFLQATNEVGEGKAVMTAVLRGIADRDYATAYGHFSEELRAEASLAEFERLMAPQQSAYTGFSSLKTQGWHIQVTSGAKSQMNYAATIRYTDGSEAAMEAVLLRESGVWKVRLFHLDR